MQFPTLTFGTERRAETFARVTQIHRQNNIMVARGHLFYARRESSTENGGFMLPGHDQYGIIISKLPVMQSGLKQSPVNVSPTIYSAAAVRRRNSR